MAVYIPPAAFTFVANSSASLPLLRLNLARLTAATPKKPKSKLKQRIFNRGRRHTVSNRAETEGFTCERRRSEEIGGDHASTQESEAAEDRMEDFMEWLCSERNAQWEAARPEVPEERETCFRCDIFATSGQDFTEAEKECKQLVIEAGGTILGDLEYLGGFLYTLPPNLQGRPPLESGDQTMLGGHIRVTPFERSQSSTFDTNQEYLGLEPPPDSLVHASLAPEDSPISPLTTRTTKTIATGVSPVSPLPLRTQASNISTPSTESKEWPRPKDNGVTKRAGDWVKAQADRRREKLDEEVRAGIGMEVVKESEYEGGIEADGLYLDGFSDLAIWMSAGGPMGRDTSGSTLC